MVTNSKRIAMNTMIMYGRMLIVMLLSFYSSRILLSTLGVTDFGILSVVGSLTVSFAAIKGLFSESVQRFLNVAKGRKESSIDEQQRIFYLSLVIHVVLAVLFFIIAECVGTWLLNNHLDIPTERFDAAFFVFHVSVIATTISIISVPYDAVVIANEKMSFYAVLSLFDSIIKLVFILLLPSIGIDYLKTYSMFLLFVPLTTLIIQFIYCKRFPECAYVKKSDKRLFRGMLDLSGWNFFGNICFSLIHEGINMLLNIYGGVVMNASRAIAYQVKNIANQVSTNTLVAIRPKIIQYSIQKERNAYFEDIFLLSRLSFFTLAIVIFPLFIFCPNLLNIWLGEYPEASVIFTRIILISLFVRTLHEPINMMNMAFAKIRRQMIVESTIMLLAFAMIYLSFDFTDNIAMPFVILTIMEIIVMVGLIINAKYEVDFPLVMYVKKVVIPMIVLIAFSFFSGLFIIKLPICNMGMLMLGVLSAVIVELVICFILLDNRERNILKRLLIKK